MTHEVFLLIVVLVLFSTMGGFAVPGLFLRQKRRRNFWHWKAVRDARFRRRWKARLGKRRAKIAKESRRRNRSV